MATHVSHPGGTYPKCLPGYPFRYLPIIPVRYTGSSAVAMLARSSKASNPPYPPCDPFVHTPVVCEWWPVRIVARLGQQSGLGTKALGNATPLSAIREAFGMPARVSHR